ncbi:MAG: hypothetical protein PHD43_06685 [Methylococcales bacterium]|nr:hypothetical protein [Methylococcales bacterium]
MGAIARGTSFKNWVVSYEVRCEITSNPVITFDNNANDSTSWCQAYEEAYHNWKRSLLITNGDLKDHYQKTIAIYESRC